MISKSQLLWGTRSSICGEEGTCCLNSYLFSVNLCTKHLGLKACALLHHGNVGEERSLREKLCKDWHWHGWEGAGWAGFLLGWQQLLQFWRIKRVTGEGGGKVREKLSHDPAASGASQAVESRRESRALGAAVGAGGGRCCCYLQQTFLSNNLEQIEGWVPLLRASISSPSAPSTSPRAGGGEAAQQILPESFSPDKRKG